MMRQDDAAQWDAVSISRLHPQDQPAAVHEVKANPECLTGVRARRLQG